MMTSGYFNEALFKVTITSTSL